MTTTGTILPIENQQEAEEIARFLAELEPSEKKDFLSFIQGVKFARVAQKVQTSQIVYKS